jgi:hypothetical protein
MPFAPERFERRSPGFSSLRQFAQWITDDIQPVDRDLEPGFDIARSIDRASLETHPRKPLCSLYQMIYCGDLTAYGVNPDGQRVALPPRIVADAGLQGIDINASAITTRGRKFTDVAVVTLDMFAESPLYCRNEPYIAPRTASPLDDLLRGGGYPLHEEIFRLIYQVGMTAPEVARS